MCRPQSTDGETHMFAVENDGVVTNGETVHYPLAVPVPMHHKVDGWSEDPCQSVSEYVWVQIVRVGSATCACN